MNRYLPEGYDFTPSPFTYDALNQALHKEQILQAPVLLCDEAHDLYVELGCCRGRIPRKEASIGIADGRTRDIAILLLVGRPVCFCVRRICADGTVTLSRKAAQEQALQALLQRKPGEILPAVVTSLADFGAFCDVGCGIPALLPLSSISVSRISHPSERLHPGQKITTVIRAVDSDKKRITLTHKELLGTWEENAAGFSQGQTVTGTVRSVQDYGVFVELTPNLSGLAEPDSTLCPGDTVSVFIKSILPEKSKIKLVILRKLDAGSPESGPFRYFQTQGRLSSWQYSRKNSELIIF